MNDEDALIFVKLHGIMDVAEFPFSLDFFHDLGFHAFDSKGTAIFPFYTFCMVLKDDYSCGFIQKMDFRVAICNQIDSCIGFLDNTNYKIRIDFFQTVINVGDRNQCIYISTTP